jgi:poly(A) polymerase
MSEKTAAIAICKKLQDAGHQAVFAGGCVRDMLLGIEAHDIDIATSASPDEVEELFDRTIAVGKQFGVIVVREGGAEFEVATFRTDGASSDSRRPDSVEFSSMEEDAKRRDFTINALFFDPISKEIHDFVGGEKDMAARKLRFVGSAASRIDEDHLRILRAFRFAAKFDMTFAPDTAKALRSLSDLSGVSAERIKAELDKMLAADKPSIAFKLMQEFGLLEIILPEVAVLDGEQHSARWHSEGDVFVHTMMVLDATARRTKDIATRWAALLHDTGKPKTKGLNSRGDIANHGHEFVSEKIAREILGRLKASTKEIEKVAFLCREHMRVKTVDKMKRFKVRRLAAHEHIWALVDLAIADGESSIATDPVMDAGKNAWKDVLMNLDSEVGLGLPRPVLTGDDLKEMGFKPGPHFKQILGKVQEMQLEDLILTTDDAKAFVLKRFKGMMNAK